MDLEIISFCFGENRYMFCCSIEDVTFVFDCGIETHLDINTSLVDKESQNSNTHSPSRILEIIDWGKVDFILISSFEQVDLLPFITENTGFNGKIYVTEPTKEYTRHSLEEKVLIKNNCPVNSAFVISKAAEINNSQLYSSPMIFSEDSENEFGIGLDAISRCVDKLVIVNFNSVIYPKSQLKIYCKSAGYAIGSANWNVVYKNKKIAFLGSSSITKGLHPLEFDTSIFDGADICLFSSIQSIRSDSLGTSAVKSLSQISTQSVSSLRNGGVVIVVTKPFGITYDIMQSIYKHCQSINLSEFQFWFISPVSKKTISLGNIMGEWLSKSNQQGLYVPEYPFCNKSLERKGLLHYFSSVEELAFQPQQNSGCVIFVSPEDMFSILFLVSFYSKKPDSLLVFTDESKRQEISSIFAIPQSLQVQVFETDTRLTSHEFANVFSSSSASTVLLPSSALPDFKRYTNKNYSRLVSSESTEVKWYSHLENFKIRLSDDLMAPIQISKDITNGKRKVYSNDYEYVYNIDGEVVLGESGYTLIPQSSDAKKSGIFMDTIPILDFEDTNQQNNGNLVRLRAQVDKLVEGYDKSSEEKKGEKLKIRLVSDFGSILINISFQKVLFKSDSEYSYFSLMKALDR
ncbi:hypothetical protein BB560_001089 [Smittium megazygosporum]|uniref:Cleavage and polyadenylation specificity factor subunit 2 n=1 Tax=Smittium megazygosporum TaxID=133381 RepID=A0A2T9ZIK9_9FUNG|nr:hypothetical protein BB560_001089 [Smittium megazygosporum]